MKKLLSFVVLGGVLAGSFGAVAGLAAVAGAQTVSGGGSAGVSGSANAGTGYASPAIIVSPGLPTPIAPPVPTPTPTTDSGFIQFNNLSIESISATNPPAEILASNPTIYPVPMMEGGVGAGTSAGAGVNGVTAVPPQAATAPSTAPSVSAQTCIRFNTQNSATGSVVPCPLPPVAPTPTSAPTTSANTPSASVAAPSSGGGNTASIAMPPSFYYKPYRIEVDASTKLMLRDRTVASLSSFSSGDQINVFGYYNTDGSIQAYLIRDISKPVATETLQLNNVTLVSISGTSVPATLAVTQNQIAPCYYFDGANGAKQQYACPLGIQSFSANSATQNVVPPAALAPNWISLRKYVVTIDAQTVILDRNRTQLSLSSLKLGDQLNVYGETSDNGQTLNADIVRDLSLPVTASNYAGTVTQVNADGSFVIQTNDGQTITAKNPIAVGTNLTLKGVLDATQNILSEISQIYIGTNGGIVSPPIPPPVPLPLPVTQ